MAEGEEAGVTVRVRVPSAVIVGVREAVGEVVDAEEGVGAQL